jgi:hypothetical protein
MKPIRLSAHALSYITKRGFTVAEVQETIRNGRWEPAELGRMERSAARHLPLIENGTRESMQLRKCGQFS